MLAALAFACSIGVCPAPSPDAWKPRRHSLTVETTNDGAVAYKATFGDDWSVVRQYVDLAIVSAHDPNLRRIRSFGIQTMLYADVNLCSSRSWPFPNPWPFPDCDGWPDSAFYSQPGHPER